MSWRRLYDLRSRLRRKRRAALFARSSKLCLQRVQLEANGNDDFLNVIELVVELLDLLFEGGGFVGHKVIRPLLRFLKQPSISTIVAAVSIIVNPCIGYRAYANIGSKAVAKRCVHDLNM